MVKHLDYAAQAKADMYVGLLRADTGSSPKQNEPVAKGTVLTGTAWHDGFFYSAISKLGCVCTCSGRNVLDF